LRIDLKQFIFTFLFSSLCEEKQIVRVLFAHCRDFVQAVSKAVCLDKVPAVRAADGSASSLRFAKRSELPGSGGQGGLGGFAPLTLCGANQTLCSAPREAPPRQKTLVENFKKKIFLSVIFL
jgi:hypothetical protein